MAQAVLERHHHHSASRRKRRDHQDRQAVEVAPRRARSPARFELQADGDDLGNPASAEMLGTRPPPGRHGQSLTRPSAVLALGVGIRVHGEHGVRRAHQAGRERRVVRAREHDRPHLLDRRSPPRFDSPRAMCDFERLLRAAHLVHVEAVHRRRVSRNRAAVGTATPIDSVGLPCCARSSLYTQAVDVRVAVQHARERGALDDAGDVRLRLTAPVRANGRRRAQGVAQCVEADEDGAGRVLDRGSGRRRRRGRGERPRARLAGRCRMVRPDRASASSCPWPRRDGAAVQPDEWAARSG